MADASGRHPVNPVIAEVGGKRAVGAVIRSHPAVASEKYVVFHGLVWGDVCPYGE